MRLSNNNITSIDDSISIADCTAVSCSNLAVANGTTLVSSLNNVWSFGNTNNNLVLGTNNNESTDTDIYVVEKWQSRKPIDMGDGLYTSFREDLLSPAEIQELIYSKLEDQYPEVAIKHGMDKNNITIRKLSLPIEIKMKKS